jgi:beta-exotoxin I transport system ATP-binding protein
MRPLVINNLSKDYGRLHALRQINLTIEEGEIFGYLGPNGAGKTTTLRITLGLVHPTNGRVELLGKSYRDHSARIDIGYLPGELNLYGNMKAGALLDYFAEFRPDHPPVLRPQLLDVFNIDVNDLSRRVKFLSHGTKQKLGLIIAMQHDPKLLLLDEPTTGLDPLVQKSLREFLTERANLGRTVFFSSHVLSEVEVLCKRVAILRAGELVAVESIDNLRRKMVRRLHIRFHLNVPPQITKQPSVVQSEVRGKEVSLLIHGDVNPLIGFISQHDIEHLVFPEPELEDIFLTYYEDRGPKGNA